MVVHSRYFVSDVCTHVFHDFVPRLESFVRCSTRGVPVRVLMVRWSSGTEVISASSSPPRVVKDCTEGHTLSPTHTEKFLGNARRLWVLKRSSFCLIPRGAERNPLHPHTISMSGGVFRPGFSEPQTILTNPLISLRGGNISAVTPCTLHCCVPDLSACECTSSLPPATPSPCRVVVEPLPSSDPLPGTFDKVSLSAESPP